MPCTVDRVQRWPALARRALSPTMRVLVSTQLLCPFLDQSVASGASRSRFAVPASWASALRPLLRHALRTLLRCARPTRPLAVVPTAFPPRAPVHVSQIAARLDGVPEPALQLLDFCPTSATPRSDRKGDPARWDARP